jgi:hypothetical protein
MEILRDHGSSPSNASAITACAVGYPVLLATASGSSTRSGSGPLRTGSGPVRVRRWARSGSGGGKSGQGVSGAPQRRHDFFCRKFVSRVRQGTIGSDCFSGAGSRGREACDKKAVLSQLRRAEFSIINTCSDLFRILFN